MMRRREWFLAALVGTGLLSAGCGQDGPTLHPVRVKLQSDGGNLADLAGSTLDVAVEGDPLLRASGTIEPDGTAELETLHAGKIRKGVQEGNYRVRIVLADDDREQTKKAAKALPPKYRQFETSGLTLKVPTTGDVTLELRKR